MKKLLLILALFIAPIAQAETVVIQEQGYDRGSGTVIYANRNGSVVLTARHVCMGMVDPYVRSADKTVSYEASVYRIHISEDVCLMKTPKIFRVTQVGLQDPVGDEAFVFTLFPGPVTGILMSIKLLESDYFPPYEIHVRWFEGIAHPGMSGSGVLNAEGQLIGVLVLGSSDSMMGGYVELRYIVELLLGVNSATGDEQPIYPSCTLPR